MTSTRTDVKKLCFYASQKNFNFDGLPIQILDSEIKIKKVEKFLEKNSSLLDNLFLEKLAENFRIRLVILSMDEARQEYGKIGRDFFILFKNDKIFYHSNAAKVTKLPSGVGKLSKPVHRFDSMIFKIKNEKIKCETCPLVIGADLTDLELGRKKSESKFGQNQ